ncbi:neuritin-like isoform X1 [Petromyzon marinus]|uniref:Neuritin-like isoform X1 n=1 Tax=Petromyzon marinus TaxID=7757 RepID=A0AAJ7WJL3_PETMA|nr:neuritin-like isoform X1 [Petromyzon marinus]
MRRAPCNPGGAQLLASRVRLPRALCQDRGNEVIEADSPGRCDAFYAGLSSCLHRLGDQLNRVRPDMDESHAVTTLCKHWEEFQACSVAAISDCQKGATDTWKSLAKDMRKLKFKGNMYALCDKSSAATRAAPTPGLVPPVALLVPLAAAWLQLAL